MSSPARIVVTGATGQLGRLVIESLLRRGVPAASIVAAGRNTAALDDLAEQGVDVRRIDFEDPETLEAAFAGADKLLLISGSEVGQRVPQHRNAIQAAVEAKVGLLVYTSIANADSTSLRLADEHQATENLIRASGLPYTLLRNGWYIENYTPQVPTYLEHSAVLGSAGNGRISAATRADYAEAAAAVLVGDGHEGAVYELGGDDAFTLSDLAAAVSSAAGHQVGYHHLPVEEYEKALIEAGVPAPFAALLADSDRGISQGDLEVLTGDLSRLIGRPTTTLSEALAPAS